MGLEPQPRGKPTNSLSMLVTKVFGYKDAEFTDMSNIQTRKQKPCLEPEAAEIQGIAKEQQW